MTAIRAIMLEDEAEILEITTMCGCINNCKVCPQDVFRKAYSGHIKLSLEDFKNALKTVPKHVIIVFSGFAEPFMNPDCPQMIKYANELGYRIRLYTTLAGLKPEGLELIKDCKFDRVTLHLPDNRKCANIPITQAYKDMLVAFMQTVGIDTFMSMDENGFQDNGRAGNGAIANKQRHIYGTFYCGLLAKPSLVMLPNCDVVLCCMDYGLKHNFGNLLTETYANIIDSEKYKKVRHNRFEHDGDTLCRNCTNPVRISAHTLHRFYANLYFKFARYGYKATP
jgi:hypothetical protein